MLKPKAAVQLIPVGDLRPWDKNPRTITEERFERLVLDLEAEPEMLRARPCIAIPDGRVVAGNMRQRAAELLVQQGSEPFLAEFPEGRIPAYVVALDEARARQWALRDNNPYGEWEDQALHEFVVELERLGGSLDLTGFPTGNVQLILAGIAPRGQGDAPPPEFPTVPPHLEGDFCCPGCGYWWSGNPKAGADTGPPVEERVA